MHSNNIYNLVLFIHHPHNIYVSISTTSLVIIDHIFRNSHLIFIIPNVRTLDHATENNNRRFMFIVH